MKKLEVDVSKLTELGYWWMDGHPYQVGTYQVGDKIHAVSSYDDKGIKLVDQLVVEYEGKVE